MKSWDRAEFGDNELAVSLWVPACSSCLPISPPGTTSLLSFCVPSLLLAFLGNLPLPHWGQKLILPRPLLMSRGQGATVPGLLGLSNCVQSSMALPLVMTCRGVTPTWKRETDRTSPSSCVQCPSVPTPASSGHPHVKPPKRDVRRKQCVTHGASSSEGFGLPPSALLLTAANLKRQKCVLTKTSPRWYVISVRGSFLLPILFHWAVSHF